MNDHSTKLLSPEELADITNRDRLIPSQPLLRKFFRGDDFAASLETLLHGVLPAKSVSEKWPDLVMPLGVSYASLGSDLTRLYFYQLLIRVGGYRRVLELGTFVGVSTLFLAEAVGAGGMVTSVELGEDFHVIAQTNIDTAHLDSRVNLLRGDAVSFIHNAERIGVLYDVILIDAAKHYYDMMIGPAFSCLAPGGLLLVDDVFMQGDALNEEPMLGQGRGVRAMLEQVATIKGAASVVLPIGDGLLMIHKDRP